MQDLITAFLVQTKECNLPGIGKLRIITSPAKPDIVHKIISPPTGEILFTKKSDKISEELIKYISHKKNLTQTEAFETIKNWCREAKDKLNAGEKIFFESIGSLMKDASGNIFLQTQEPFKFFEPVTVESVIGKKAQHAVLVSDRGTTSPVMNQLLQEEETVQRSTWKMIAIILLAIALVVLLVHFYIHSFSLSSTGNQTQHLPATPADTYSTQ